MTPRPKRQPVTSERAFLASEVAVMLHVSYQTIWKWSKAGLIRFERTAGGKSRYLASHVREYCERQGIEVPKEAREETPTPTETAEEETAEEPAESPT